MRVASFHPSLMEPETLERLLVARRELAGRITGQLWDSGGGAGKPSILLTGPRGVGKSHLVAVVMNRLRERNASENRLALAWLDEDPWSIQTFFDLLARILRKLEGEAAEAVLRRAAKDELKDEARREWRAWEAIGQCIGPRTLVLAAEGLDQILANLGEDGQKRWRALLQESACWSILGTALTVTADIREYTAPFFGHFAVEPLAGATAEQGAELAARLEVILEASQLDLVETHAAGNYRVLVMLAERIRAGSNQPLREVLDLLTPHYQLQMERLSVQQRKILCALMEAAGPLTVTGIAECCSITPQTAAAQLTHLREDGLVLSAQQGRESHYEIAEPLLRLAVKALSAGSAANSALRQS